MEKNNKVEITKIYDMGKPVEAVQVAMLLKNIIIQQRLFVEIRGKNFVTIEGWQLAGFLTGMDVVVEEPKNISTPNEVKYSAVAKLYKGDKVVGIGYAVCSSKEALKKGFDEYAILSMVQTRCISKAYRNKIGFIMKLAGFQGTPAEEMQKMGEKAPDRSEPVIQREEEVSAPLLCVGRNGKGCPDGNTITAAEKTYSLKIYKKQLCRSCQKSK